MWQIFKTKMLIYHSKAILYVKILFSNITHLVDSEFRKRGSVGTKIPHSILVHDLLAIQVKSISETDNGMSNKSLTRMERGIIYSHTNPLQAFF